MKRRKHAGIFKVNNRWRALVEYNKKRYHVGYFDTEEEAIGARDKKYIELGISDSIIDLDGEVWNESPTLGSNYRISNKGRIKSLLFKGSGYEKILKPTIAWNNNYYGFITPSASYLVHRLVMEAFCGASDLQVNHKDGDSFNDCLDNLEYVSNRENSSHAKGGAKGCCLTNGKWMATIRVNGKGKTLGYYNTYEEAHQIYINALKERGIENRYIFEGKIV